GAPGRVGGVNGGTSSSASPLKPVDVAPVSCAGISSLRRDLSGSSQAISNSIGTRFSPWTRRVRPVTVKLFTHDSRFSPPSAGPRRGQPPPGPPPPARARPRPTPPPAPPPSRTFAIPAYGSLPLSHDRIAHRDGRVPDGNIDGRRASAVGSPNGWTPRFPASP